MPHAECNAGYFSWRSYKNRLTGRIDNEFSGNSPNTKNSIASLSQPSYWSNPTSTHFKTGQSIAQYLASAYGLNDSNLTVISPAKYKSNFEYNVIISYAKFIIIDEPTCVTVVLKTINSEHPNETKYCDLSGINGDSFLLSILQIPFCNLPEKNIVLDGICRVGSLQTGYPFCPQN